MEFRIKNKLKMYKLVVTVPEKYADKIREVLAEAHGGEIGNYTHCSFSVKGIGRFKGNINANPTIGEKERIEEVLEERIEINVSEENLNQVLDTVRKNHPYEEPVIDVYKLYA